MPGVSEVGFMKIPMTVALRADLSESEKFFYGFLKHLSWRNGGLPIDPSVSDLARVLHLAENTVRSRVRKLQAAPLVEGDDREDAPRLLDVDPRRRTHETSFYIVHDPEIFRTDAQGGGSKVAFRELQKLRLDARARSSYSV